MLTAGLMASMSDEHLATALRAEFDPLTSTPIEFELLGRFEALLKHSAVISLVEEHEIMPDEIDALGKALTVGAGIGDLSAVVGVLEEFGVIEPALLREKLERANNFYDIANDAGDVFTRLNDLANSTL